MTSDGEVDQIQMSPCQLPKQVEEKGNFIGTGKYPLSKSGRKES